MAISQVTKNYAGILAARIFIGIPESAFYPGAIYLLSRWYTRKACILDLKEPTCHPSFRIRNWPSDLPSSTVVC